MTLADRVQEIEIKAAHHDKALRRMYHAVDTHTLQLRDMNRHLEDLDNRGRVRGLSETVETDQLLSTVVSL